MTTAEEACWEDLRRKLVAFQDAGTPPRKPRLFACAAARTVFHLMGDERSRHAVETAERQAEGLASEGQLAEAREDAFDAVSGQASRAALWAADPEPWLAASMTTSIAFDAATEALGRVGSEQRVRRLGRTFMCIFGSRLLASPPTLDPAWLAWNDGTVKKLAEAIYEERAFERMPLLADAIEDAGCDEQELLGHLRGCGLHARGCWAIDLLLQKE